jgi:hypothetical protein
MSSPPRLRRYRPARGAIREETTLTGWPTILQLLSAIFTLSALRHRVAPRVLAPSRSACLSPRRHILAVRLPKRHAGEPAVAVRWAAGRSTAPGGAGRRGDPAAGAAVRWPYGGGDGNALGWAGDARDHLGARRYGGGRRLGAEQGGAYGGGRSTPRGWLRKSKKPRDHVPGLFATRERRLV